MDNTKKEFTALDMTDFAIEWHISNEGNIIKEFRRWYKMKKGVEYVT